MENDNRLLNNSKVYDYIITNECQSTSNNDDL